MNFQGHMQARTDSVAIADHVPDWQQHGVVFAMASATASGKCDIHTTHLTPTHGFTSYAAAVRLYALSAKARRKSKSFSLLPCGRVRVLSPAQPHAP